MCFGTVVCYVTHGHIQSQTVVMVKNDCVTDWRHLFSVFIWLQLSVWIRSINGSISLFMFRVLWWIKAETDLMHHADVSYTWNISSVFLNRWCVRTSWRIMSGFVVLAEWHQGNHHVLRKTWMVLWVFTEMWWHFNIYGLAFCLFIRQK